MKNTVLYLDKLNVHMEKMLLNVCPPEIDLRFMQPTIGQKGELADAACVFVTNFHVTKEIIDAAPNLKLIQRTGVGVDNVDIAYATQKGIPVSISKGCNNSSVAELAIGLILSLYRHIVQLDPLTKKGEWHTWTYRHDSYEIIGKTVGVVGAGMIGREVIKRLRAFDANIIYYDVFRMSPEQEAVLGVTYVDFDSLIREADIITLHLPWLESTRGMIGSEQFRQMKKSAILINTARGPVVDQAALVEALKTGEIWGAACDVFSSEPADPNDPLFKLGNINLITTPHLGAATYDNYDRVFRLCVGNMLKLLNGEELLFVINPKV